MTNPDSTSNPPSSPTLTANPPQDGVTETPPAASPKASGLLGRVPLRPGTAGGVLAAALVLVLAEFVRSGFYGGYFPQVVDRRFHLPVAVGGLAWTTHLVADTLMRGPAGLLIQRFGPRRVVMAGMVVSLAAMSLLLLPQSTPLILFIAALHGVGFAPVWPTTMNLAADAAKPGYEGRTLTVVSTAIMPLSGLGLMVYGFLDGRTDNLPTLLALGLLAAGTLLTTLLPNVRHLKQAPAEPEHGRPTRSVAQALLPLLPAALMQTLTQNLIGIWLFRVAPSFGLGKWDLIGLLVVGGGVAFASMPRTGRFADHGGARVAVTLGYALVAVGMALFALMPPVWALFGCAVIIGLGYAFLTPGWAALVTQVLPEAQRPSAWGFLMTVESAGFAAGPMLGGLALAQAGVRGPFALGAALALLTALGYLMFRKVFERHLLPDPVNHASP